MAQNYPNPFNPTTSINFYLSKSGIVEIKICDVIGREVKILLNEFKTSGNHTVQFDASSLSSGVYFYSLNSGSYSETKKMLLVK